MKRYIALMFCISFFTILTACAAQTASGTSSGSSLSSSEESAAGASSAASDHAAGSSSSSSGTSQTQASLESTQTVTANLSDGSGSVTLTLPVPDGWQLDGYTTFMLDGRKVLEVGGVWKLPVYSDSAAPFTKEMTDPFLNSEIGYPEGYGLQSTLDLMLDGRHAKMILYKTWPDDSDKPWYPHYLFYVVPNEAASDYYVVRLDFFSFEESAEDDTLFSIAQGMTATSA